MALYLMNKNVLFIINFIRIFVNNMTDAQINNLLTFTIMFNRSLSDSYFMNCDIDYIYEKYQKMIGFDPIEVEVDRKDFTDVQSVLNLKRDWTNKWKSQLNKKQESVLNYLCMTNIAILYPYRIFEIFQKYIGEMNNIEKIEYSHIHPMIKEFISDFKNRFKREINIEKLC